MKSLYLWSLLLYYQYQWEKILHKSSDPYSTVENAILKMLDMED